jgi:hypothetical protein
MQKLKGMIDAHNLSLGDTPTGKDWCLKALHPSDPLTEVRGVPDESCLPTVLMNYQSTFTLGPAPTILATDTWQFNMALVPHPVVFLSGGRYDPTTGATYHTFMNTQLTGATHTLKYADLLLLAQRWRLAYMSVTIYQDAPALADQGTLVACQTSVKPRMATYSYTGAVTTAFPPVARFESEDYPEYTSSQSMPNAYFGKSKEGLYMPLHLTRTSQNWRSESDSIYCTGFGSMAADGAVQLPTTTADVGFPFGDLVRAWVNPGVAFGGQPTSDLCNDGWGFICARNLAPTTTYSFFVRAGFEFQVQPGTQLSCQQKISPEFDPTAIKHYFQIVRGMKDAYPADYNDLGKIWDVISGIAKTVAPALNFIPGLGPIVSGAVTGVAGIGDSVRKALTRTASDNGRQSIASASDIEMAQKALRPPEAIRLVVPPRPVSNLRASVPIVAKRRRKSKARTRTIQVRS